MNPEAPLPARASAFDYFASRMFDASLKTIWRNEPERWRREAFWRNEPENPNQMRS